MTEPEKWNPIESLGATGATVAHNVTRLRKEKRLAYTELSEGLDKIGRVIPTLGLRKIESGGRRVDTDDLVALALVLGVSPITLLLPASDERNSNAAVTGEDPHPVERIWDWLRAEIPFGQDDRRSVIEFQADCWPAWADLPVSETINIAEGRKRDAEHLRRRRAEKRRASNGDD